MSATRGTNRRQLWTVVTLCIAADLVALLVLLLWHPFPFGLGADFNQEAYPPYVALAHGHLLGFVATSPSYMGSMLMRLPFALIPIWLGGSSLTVCFWASVPGVLAPPLLALWLTRRGDGRLRLQQLPLLLATVNPVTLFCLSFGHPEDLLTACLAIAAVVCAGDNRPRAAGVLIAAAIIAKPWAAVAAPVVFAVSGSPRHVLPQFVKVSGAFWVPFLLTREFTGGGAAGAVSASTQNIFHTADLLFWLGPHSWLVHSAHALILVAACGCAGLWKMTARDIPPSARTQEGLWLLALVFFIRAAFDPWDNPYYHLPFLLALMAAQQRRLPLLPLLASVVFCVAVNPSMISSGSQMHAPAIYAAVAVPTLCLLIGRVFFPALLDRWHRSETRHAEAPDRAEVHSATLA